MAYRRSPWRSGALRSAVQIALLSLTLLVTLMPTATSTTTTPASLLGVFRGSGKATEVAAYEKWVGAPVSYALDFIGREPLTSTAPWAKIDNPLWWCNQWKGSGRIVTYSVAMLPNTNFTLAAGARGDYDAHWRNFFRVMVANGCGDSIIRLGWEFNGKFYPWAAGGKETSFVAYWRKIVTIARAAGFIGKFDWCPLAGNVNANVEAAYPGDAYVDIIGLDAYDTSSKIGSTGLTRWNDQLTRKYGLNWHRDFADLHNKPRSFPEWGITKRPKDNLGGGDNPFYITSMLNWFRGQTYADTYSHGFLYADYFEVDASDAAHRLMLGQFPKARDAFLAGT